MPGHIPRPEYIHLTISGVHVRLRHGVAVLLSEFVDGEYHGEPASISNMRVLLRHGWVLRTRGHCRLTLAGQDAHAVVTAYFARKADALNGDT